MDLFSGEIIKSFARKFGHTHKKLHVMKVFEINASKTWYTFFKKHCGKCEFKKETRILRLQQFNQEISLLSNKVRTEIETDMCKKNMRYSKNTDNRTCIPCGQIGNFMWQ